jgi:hypothetical protein
MSGDSHLVHAIGDAVEGAVAARKAGACLDDARTPVVLLMEGPLSSEDRAELELCRTSLTSYFQHLQAISKATTSVAERLERLQQKWTQP